MNPELIQLLSTILHGAMSAHGATEDPNDTKNQDREVTVDLTFTIKGGIKRTNRDGGAYVVPPPLEDPEQPRVGPAISDAAAVGST